MNLDSDDFTLFGLQRVFVQDRADLDGRWKALQAEVHPDRFASAGAAAQRVAMQWAVRVNEAYQRLKNPLKRAAYLCELHGAPIQAESNTAMPAAFLMRQMEWREALDDAHGDAALEALRQDVATQRRRTLDELGQLLDVEHNFAAAAQAVRALMFVERFADEIERKQDTLD